MNLYILIENINKIFHLELSYHYQKKSQLIYYQYFVIYDKNISIYFDDYNRIVTI